MSAKANSVDNPAPGNPTDYEAIAAQFGELSTVADAAASQLRRLSDSCDVSIWRGTAADAFRDKIAKLPEQLTKLHSSYATAADAVATYGRTLAGLQSQAGPAMNNVTSAQSNEQASVTALDQKQRTVTATTTMTGGATPPDTTQEERAVADARAAVQRSKAQVQHIADDRKNAEKQCIAKLQDAHNQGIKNSAWTKIRILRDVVDVLEVVGIVLALVIVAVIVIGLLTTTGPLLAVFGTALLAELGAAALGVGAAKLAVNLFRKSLGDEEVSYGSLAWDAASLVVPYGGGKAIASISSSVRVVVTETEVVTRSATVLVNGKPVAQATTEITRDTLTVIKLSDETAENLGEAADKILGATFDFNDMYETVPEKLKAAQELVSEPTFKTTGVPLVPPFGGPTYANVPLSLNTFATAGAK